VFDVTATSNHWVLDPGRNLGLQLTLDSTRGECQSHQRTAEVCLGLVPHRDRRWGVTADGARNEEMASTLVPFGCVGVTGLRLEWLAAYMQ